MRISRQSAQLAVVAIMFVVSFSQTSFAAFENQKNFHLHEAAVARMAGSYNVSLSARLPEPALGNTTDELSIAIDQALIHQKTRLNSTPQLENAPASNAAALPASKQKPIKQARLTPHNLVINKAPLKDDKPHIHNKEINKLNKELFQKAGLDMQTGCLALAIYYEARSETRLGQIAISQVILNRVKSRKYPNSICNVVYQNAHMSNRCQFSFTCDGRAEDPQDYLAWVKSMALAEKINCRTACQFSAHEIQPLKLLSPGLRLSTHYHATYVSPKWAYRLKRSGKIGLHIFYISARVWAALPDHNLIAQTQNQ